MDYFSYSLYFWPRLLAELSGLLVLLVGLVTLFNQFGESKEYIEDRDKAYEGALKYGNSVFIPVVMMALSAIVIAYVFPDSSRTVIGIGALISLFFVMILFKPSVKETLDETNRMIQQVGTTSILPQLLAALGTIFVAAGVGDIVTAYVLGMMLLR